jgi:hypothetical protein
MMARSADCSGADEMCIVRVHHANEYLRQVRLKGRKNGLQGVTGSECVISDCSPWPP